MAISAMYPALVLAALGSLLAVAVVTDARARRIPNKLVAVGLIIAFTNQLLGSAVAVETLSGPHWWSALAGFGVGFAALMPLYLTRACGAGDVKLMAMVGAFVGPSTVLHATLATLVAGGALSLVFMLSPGVATRTIANLRGMLTVWTINIVTRQGLAVPPPLQTTAARLPYAVSIAAGTAIALALRLQGTGA